MLKQLREREKTSAVALVTYVVRLFQGLTSVIILKQGCKVNMAEYYLIVQLVELDGLCKYRIVINMSSAWLINSFIFLTLTDTGGHVYARS